MKNNKPKNTKSKIDEGYQSDLEKLKPKNRKENVLEKHNPYKEKPKQLEQENKKLIEKITKLENHRKIKGNNQEEHFNCYNCQKEQIINLLVLEIPDKGLLCKNC